MKSSRRWSETHQEKKHFMNTSNSIHHTPSPALGAASIHKPVNFFCAAPKAHRVELAGDFNHWRPYPMERSLDGWWLARVELTHGHHQYRFLVDGVPTLDPTAAGIVRDVHGEKASLMAVS